MADEERKITRISGVCYSSARAEWSATNDRGARVVCERWRRSDGCCFAALLELSGAVERSKWQLSVYCRAKMPNKAHCSSVEAQYR